jgi:hypothetical protein
MIRRHLWSILSLLVSVGTSLAIGSYTQYQYRYHHVTDFSHLSVLGSLAVVVSVLTGGVGVFKERASVISLIAVTLGVFSVVFYSV